MLKNHIDVLIVGAGPVGLTLALALTQQGIHCRIIDKKLAISEQSRAIAIHARTLEMLADLGIVEQFVVRGHHLQGVQLYAKQQHLFSMNLNHLDTPYPGVLTLAQQETESILQGQLADFGREIEFNVALQRLVQTTEGVVVQLLHDENQQEQLQAKYVIGCDGAHSEVRKQLQVSFAGSQYAQHWLNGDVYANSQLNTGFAHVYFQGQAVLALFPLSKERFRIVSNYQRFHPDAVIKEHPSLAELQAIVEQFIPSKLQLTKALWLNTFAIHFQSVAAMQCERVFLAGDAAHIHSPVGGQGMNTGMQDAYNLAWKLAYLLQGQSGTTLLASYNAERMPVAKHVLQMTQRFMYTAVASSFLLRFLRNWLLPLLLKNKRLRQRMLQQIAQLSIHYRHSPVTREVWTRPHLGKKVRQQLQSGDRVPDMSLLAMPAKSSINLHKLIQGTKFDLFVFTGQRYKPAEQATLQKLCMRAQQQYPQLLNCHVIASTATAGLQLKRNYYLDEQGKCHRRFGLRSAGYYLIRPDGYIGFRANSLAIEPLLRYLQDISA